MKPLYNVERLKNAGSVLPDLQFFYNGQICLTVGISFSLSGGNPQALYQYFQEELSSV